MKKIIPFASPESAEAVSLTRYVWLYAVGYALLSTLFTILLFILILFIGDKLRGIGIWLTVGASMLAANFVCKRFYKNNKRLLLKAEYKKLVRFGALTSFLLSLPFVFLALSLILASSEASFGFIPTVVIFLSVFIALPIQWFVSWIGFCFATRSLANRVNPRVNLEISRPDAYSEIWEKRR